MRPEEKVYRAYHKSKKHTLYFNEIKELSELSDSSLANTLSKLVKERILEKKETKSNTFYSIKHKKIFAIKYSEFAIKQFDELPSHIKVPLKHFLKELPKEIHTILLFGSAAQGEEHENSDIDLLVVAQKKPDLSTHKKAAEVTAKHPLSIAYVSINDCNSDELAIQAKKTGFPIFGEQTFYEALLDEHRQTI